MFLWIVFKVPSGSHLYVLHGKKTAQASHMCCKSRKSFKGVLYHHSYFDEADIFKLYDIHVSLKTAGIRTGTLEN